MVYLGVGTPIIRFSEEILHFSETLDLHQGDPSILCSHVLHVEGHFRGGEGSKWFTLIFDSWKGKIPLPNSQSESETPMTRSNMLIGCEAETNLPPTAGEGNP